MFLVFSVNQLIVLLFVVLFTQSTSNQLADKMVLPGQEQVAPRHQRQQKHPQRLTGASHLHKQNPQQQDNLTLIVSASLW